MLTPLERWIFRKVGSKASTLKREEVEAYQLKKVRETLKWARKKSRFYRERLRGLTEDELVELGDLARFPFTLPEDLRKDPPGFLCVSQNEMSRVVTLETSGTIGDPKRVFFTESDQELTIDFFHWGMSTLVEAGNRVIILLPGDRPGSVGDLLRRALGRLGASSVVHGPVQDPRATLEVMEKNHIDAIVGIPVQVLGLVRAGGGRCAPRSVLLSTDYVPGSISRALEKAWGCEVFHHYGMTEMGFGGGVDCRAHSGYHFREADLYVEIVDPETGSPVSEGTEGEVVFTTLTRKGMPLIRYRTGDLSCFIPDPCPCGTSLRTMQHVSDRISGRLPLSGGGFLSMADLDEVLFGISEVLDFTATLRKDEVVEVLDIELIVNGGDATRISAVAREMLEHLPSMELAIEGKGVSIRVNPATSKRIIGTGSSKRRILDARN